MDRRSVQCCATISSSSTSSANTRSAPTTRPASSTSSITKDQPVGGGLDYYQWASILRAVSALTSYHWIYRDSLKPWLIADLLILRREMPRSLARCYANISELLTEIAQEYGEQGPSQSAARATYARLANQTMDNIFQRGLHEFLLDFIAENNRLGSRISEQYLS